MISSLILGILLPDRLPSLVVLVGFWIFPAVAGWVAAGLPPQDSRPGRMVRTMAILALVVLVYVAAWYFWNLHRMPPYIQQAPADPSVATPEAAASLALVTLMLVLPGSALACALAYRHRRRQKARADASPVSS